MTTPTNTEELLAALKKVAGYLGKPTSGSFDGLDDDDFIKLHAFRVRIGDIREAWAAIASAEQAHAGEDSPRKPGDMRKVVEALGFEPDNHHNAAKCPYCTPEPAKDGPTLQDEGVRAALERLVQAKDLQRGGWDYVTLDAAWLLAKQAVVTLSRGEAADELPDVNDGQDYAEARSGAPILSNLPVHHHEAGGAPGREAEAGDGRGVQVACADPAAIESAALELAVAMLACHEPPDSRAVSNEYVALACVAAGQADAECATIIRKALAEIRKEG